MARIVGGSPFGEIRGKLGGNVFARNRAGAYIRQYVVPTNPNSAAQDAARYTFGTAVSTYHTLTAAQKASWQNFASGVYSPKVGVNIGQFSGFNAYCSLRSTVQQGNRLIRTGTMSLNGSAFGTPATYSNFEFSETPPVYTVQGAIKEQTTGHAIELSLQSASVASDGSFEITIQVGDGTTGHDVEDFIDPNDKAFGFSVFMSDSVPQEGMFIPNEYSKCLGFIGHPTADSADRTAATDFGFTSTDNVNPGDYQNFPSVGQHVKISLFEVGIDGSQICIGSKIISIEAP